MDIWVKYKKPYGCGVKLQKLFCSELNKMSRYAWKNNVWQIPIPWGGSTSKGMFCFIRNELNLQICREVIFATPLGMWDGS